MKKQEPNRRGKVTHVMANGEVRDSVAGYLTSADQLPETARRIIRGMMLGEYSKGRK
ncbi:hypothetical protein [Anaerotignum sp.]|uniref:hypothetical protein n=1 Tax=Anaerotignum sp. TaxID=2039241 RepID=UPI0027154BD6|nr:hypothetical protein [Anaerotignum sp.]